MHKSLVGPGGNWWSLVEHGGKRYAKIDAEQTMHYGGAWRILVGIDIPKAMWKNDILVGPAKPSARP